MPSPSLFKMASRACIKNIRSITDVGDAPYQLVRSILLRIQNPQQLRQIELASPQICGPDGEIWLEFIKRDVSNWDRKSVEPENPKKWYKAYKKLVMDSQKEVEDDAAELKATMDRIKQNQALHKAQRVELRGVKVPEGIKSNGPVISLSVMPKFYDKGRNYAPPPFQPKRDSDAEGDLDAKPDPDAKAPKSKLDQFRKQAKAMGHFQTPAKRPGFSTPRDTKLRPVTTNRTISIAPQTLIDEHRKAAAPKVLDPSVKPAVVFTPQKKRARPDEFSHAGDMTTEQKEKRLKAFTNPSGASRSTPNLEASTLTGPNSATSPPRREAKIASPTAIKLATSAVPDTQATPRLSSPLKRKDGPSPTPGLSSPLKRKDGPSPTPGHGVSRAATSSPSNGGIRPAMPLKKKAPVDVFMPAKRRKLT